MESKSEEEKKEKSREKKKKKTTTTSYNERSWRKSLRNFGIHNAPQRHVFICIMTWITSIMIWLHQVAPWNAVVFLWFSVLLPSTGWYRTLHTKHW